MIKRLMKHKALMSLAVLCMTLMATSAFAYTTPTSGDLMYDVYDILIVQLLGGPVGFVIAAIMFLGGIFLLVQGKGFLLPFVCLSGAVVIIKCEAIVSSFGFSILDGIAKANAALPSVSQFLF